MGYILVLSLFQAWHVIGLKKKLCFSLIFQINFTIEKLLKLKIKHNHSTSTTPISVFPIYDYDYDRCKPQAYFTKEFYLLDYFFFIQNKAYIE